jgi:hypothetical protein
MSGGTGRFAPPATATKDTTMRYLHTMVRVEDIDASLHFYCDLWAGGGPPP